MKRLLLYGCVGILIVGFVGFGAVLSWFAGVNICEELAVWLELRGARDWPIESVEIVDGRRVTNDTRWYPLPSRAECRFRVTRNGAVHEITQQRFSGHYSFFSTSHDAFISRLTSDGTAVIRRDSVPIIRPARVNPNDPSQAYLLASFDDLALGTSLIFAFFILGIGLSMILIVGVIAWSMWFSSERKDLSRPEVSEGGHRLTPDSVSRCIWLWSAIVMTPGVIPAAYLIVPEILRTKASPAYWIPVAIQCGLAALFWLLFWRATRWQILAGHSYLQLDGRPITRANAPTGRLYLAPMRDLPDRVTLIYRLYRRVSSKYVRMDHRSVKEVHRQDDGSQRGSWYPVSDPASVDVNPARSMGSYWQISVRGRTNGSRFKIEFVSAAL